MEKILKFLEEWKEMELPEIKERASYIAKFVEMDHTIDILGPRRAGKTYLMFYLIKKLLADKNTKENVIYLNLENSEIDDKDILDLRSYSLTLLERYKKVYWFLDEIQNLENWIEILRTIYDENKGKIKIFVTGSTSRMWKKDISTKLTGRHISFYLYPLSFKEYLDFRNFNLEGLKYSETKKTKLLLLLKEYLEFGGYPEVVLQSEKTKKSLILRDYFHDTLYKDLIRVYHIRAINILETFVRFLFDNIGGYLSYSRMKKWFESIGYRVSTKTVYTYTNYLEEIFLFKFIPIYVSKVRELLKFPTKIYCLDTGLRNINTTKPTKDLGSLIENAVAIDFLRKKSLNPSMEIYYYRTGHGEVDFLVKEGLKVKQLNQVCYDIQDFDTKKRELDALVKASKEVKCNNLRVITWDYEGEEELKGRKIKFVPLWKLLIE